MIMGRDWLASVLTGGVMWRTVGGWWCVLCGQQFSAKNVVDAAGVIIYSFGGSVPDPMGGVVVVLILDAKNLRR